MNIISCIQMTAVYSAVVFLISIGFVLMTDMEENVAGIIRLWFYAMLFFVSSVLMAKISTA